jgi:hypothetical protein
MIMPRIKAEKRSELEAFWHSHLEEWQCSRLNQREYCALHGLPLKRFGNWRAKFKDEAPVVRGRVLYRRGGSVRHMAGHMSDKEIGPVTPGYIPSVRSSPPERRRDYSEADKKRIVEEASRPGATVSGVARRHGIAARVLFRWKQELSSPLKPETTFLPVTVSDMPDSSAVFSSAPIPAAIIVERSSPGIEVELIGGRRVRFERDVAPETIRSLVALLEGGGS